ncbi:hypothetical protein TTHERM_00349000 (macronuclear) [Tetrahymena thermophila SB210]|uniref:Uncharacterized protein n=1 Tax=Tetrahymena thermophila (strain SB210) TaxID=312017 RepID=I7M3B2_TETTS|nr:hypothetical protein TTHERM_00349000 [Tetrahymena thermophila SB210]EAS02810.2 hypothetical protein TTHERM_00349000 [Tetrahymena thermophila SB210]|eukprot:XP_001023055.2 hypothetical protein TTHERM_00349000 [Tetrahymena thermophila SB210]
MIPQQPFVPMPYYYPMVPVPTIPQGTPQMMMMPNQFNNANQSLANNQNDQMNGNYNSSGADRKRAQSQNDLDFEDILDKEKFKFDSVKNMNKKGDFLNQGSSQQIQPNIFKPGNHSSHFNPKSMNELVVDKQKKNQYAQLLQQQIQIKKELDHEKKILDNKHNLQLHLERQKNDMISYNMPIRDQYGNILQSRGQPGNRNYQLQDWFTFVPNINQKYIQEEDIPIVEQATSALKQNLANPHSHQVDAFYRQQQNLINFENKNKRPLQFSFSNGQQKQQITFDNNYNQRFNSQQDLQYQDNGQQYNNRFQNQYEDDDEDQENDNGNHRVRIVTPTKYKRANRGTQTPHLPDELNQLQNQQIGDLYPNLLRNSSLAEIPTQSRIQTGYNRIPSSGQLLGIHPSSVRFTEYLKGDYKYANDIDKMRKREQYIQLQNEQMNQMEEKKRQKELNKIQEKRERDLDDLRVMREQQQLNEKFSQEFSSVPVDRRNLKESFVPDINNQKFSQRGKNFNTSFSNYEVQHTLGGKKGKRPRTPIEDAINPFQEKEKFNTQTSSSSNQIIIQEIPFKVKEQVGDAISGELSKLRSEMRASQGFIQNELSTIKKDINVINQQKGEQEQKQNILYNEINKTRLVDEIRRRELEQRMLEKERSEREKIEDEISKNLLENPGFTRYDLQNQKKVFFEFDDQYNYEPDRINQDIGRILREGELPSQKIQIHYNDGGINKVNYVTYDDGFQKTTNEILSNQQQKIEERLKNMGLGNLEQPKSLSTIYQNYSTNADSLSENNNNFSKIYKNSSLTEINRPSAANSDTDDIYKDLIKGNQEHSKVFNKKEDNKLDIEDFVMWNSKAARYR